MLLPLPQRTYDASLKLAVALMSAAMIIIVASTALMITWTCLPQPHVMYHLFCGCRALHPLPGCARCHNKLGAWLQFAAAVKCSREVSEKVARATQRIKRKQVETTVPVNKNA